MRFIVEYDCCGEQKKFETEEGDTIKDAFLRVSDAIAVSVNVSGVSPLPLMVSIREVADAQKV